MNKGKILKHCIPDFNNSYTLLKKIEMKYKTLLAKLIILVIIISISFLHSNAQVVTAGKYNDTDYSEDRVVINAMKDKFDSAYSLNDNYVGIGAEGRIYYGKAAERKSFADNGFVFKSVNVQPGTTLLRIFNGTAAIKTFVADVVFTSPKGDLVLSVIRSETYIKQAGKWYYVAGQGTRVQSDKELEETTKKLMKKN